MLDFDKDSKIVDMRIATKDSLKDSFRIFIDKPKPCFNEVDYSKTNFDNKQKIAYTDKSCKKGASGQAAASVEV